jgi:hypothetical protein
VQLLPDPPTYVVTFVGAIAQLGERLVCNQKVTGSIPVGSTNFPILLAATRSSVKNCLPCPAHDTRDDSSPCWLQADVISSDRAMLRASCAL